MFLKFIGPTKTSVYETDSFTMEPVRIDRNGNFQPGDCAAAGDIPGLAIRWGRDNELVLANHEFHFIACYAMNSAGATIETFRAPETSKIESVDNISPTSKSLTGQREQ